MITLSPSRTSSVGPGIWPLYANTSLITPGRSGNRAGAAVMLTSTICGRDERLRKVRGDAKAPLVGLTSARFNWICLPGTVATPKDDSQPRATPNTVPRFIGNRRSCASRFQSNRGDGACHASALSPALSRDTLAWHVPLTTALSHRYRIERELGCGGMATVYLAADLRHGLKVSSGSSRRQPTGSEEKVTGSCR